MREQYKSDPSSLDSAWVAYFENGDGGSGGGASSPAPASNGAAKAAGTGSANGSATSATASPADRLLPRQRRQRVAQGRGEDPVGARRRPGSTSRQGLGRTEGRAAAR